MLIRHRKRYDRLFSLLLLALLPTLAAGASEKAPQPPLQAGSEYDYPPFAVVTPDGRADGFSVELLREALRVMGREVEFKVDAWQTIKQDLAAGRLDVLPLVARTPSRADQFDFSIPYLTMHGTIIVRKGEARIQQLSDLRHVRVAVMAGDIAEDYVRANRLATDLSTTRTVEDALRELDEGRHDAVVVQKLVGETLLKSRGFTRLESVGAPLGEYQDFSFAVRDGNSALLETLNEGLSIIIANGTFARLHAKWLAPLETPRPLPLLPIVAAAALTLLVAWGVAYLWQRSLRRKVASRTARLSAANAQLAQQIRERHATEQALRRTSEELETLFANVHSHIAVLDPDFRFVRVNDAYAEGVARTAESLIGVNHFDLFPHAENEEIFRSVVTTGRTYSVRAKPFEYPDQPERGVTYWDWTVCALKDGSGQVESLIFVLTDVTEQEQQRRAIHDANRRAQAELERRVQERTAELKAANQELQSFSYSVSHDLLGPLRAINGFSHALEEDCGTAFAPQAQAHLARIREATVRMAKLIDGLLKLSQVFRSELQVTEVELSALAHEIVGLLQESEPQRAVQVSIEPGLTANGDGTLLRVVLENLLNNAWKFTSQRERAAISFGRETVRGCKAFYVRDNGIGFDMAYVNKLFRPFERLHVHEGFSGTGIGLATVQRVVRRHLGTIWVEAKPDCGATFYFTLHSVSGACATPDEAAGSAA